jgi:hypothetical protein
MKQRIAPAIGMGLIMAVVLAIPATADLISVISVNFSLTGNEGNSVGPDQSATQFADVGGQYWNNIVLRTTASNGTVEHAFDGTSLVDDAGANAATLNTTIGVGGGYVALGNTSSPNQTSTGEAGMMQSYLNFGGSVPAETITINGLGSSFTSAGYEVYLFFDYNGARTYGFTVDDGTVSSSFWTADTSTTADSNNDGVMEWNQAVGTTSGTATPNGNYARYTGLSGSSFTISGVSTSGRAVLNGMQIVAIPEPSSLVLVGLAFLSLAVFRKHRG